MLYRLDTALPGGCLDSTEAGAASAGDGSPCLGDAAAGSSPPFFFLGTMMGILKRYRWQIEILAKRKRCSR